MEQLIPIASKLQDVLGALGQSTTLDLPQIVVVGGQSSGKSSVLEGIVGRSFLPRGHGIVTRRPLILQLYNTAGPSADEDEEEEERGGGGISDEYHEFNDVDITTTPGVHDNDTAHDGNEVDPRRIRGGGGGGHIDNDHDDLNSPQEGRVNVIPASKEEEQQQQNEEWGEFLHLPGRRFHDFTSIRREIIRETERLVGKNMGIHPAPIHLKIYSPRVLALTLVDLPGMAKVAVGDQPPDIEDQIRDMCLEFIANPNAIILAVTAANTDIANSDALKLARHVDPYGERTVGVLTKLDLMDPGTDAADVLRNKIIPLRKGYVGIVNRGQRDVDSDLSIREGLRKEQAFFKTHPVYGRDRTLVGKCGTANLAKTLNGMLMHHVRECLPELKNRIANMMSDVQLELDDLGTAPTDGISRATLGGSLLSLLSKFTANFSSMIDGRGNVTNPGGPSSTSFHGGSSSGNATGPTGRMAETLELYGGARISYIFNDVFSTSLMSVGPFDGLTDEEIRTAICNANGTRPSLFVPEFSFDILVRRQISRLEQPGIQCVDLVYEELQRIASQCEPGELTRFPSLRDRMVEVVSALLKRCVGPTQMMVSNLVRIELAYINTSHPDFIGGARAVAQLMEKMGKIKEEEKNGASNSNTTANNNNKGRGNRMSLDTVDPVINGNGPDDIGGATPLSSSSLSNYCAMDEDGTMATPNPPRTAQRNNGSVHPTPYYDANGGGSGIMNFIFGGGGNKMMGHTSTGPGPSMVGFRSPAVRHNGAGTAPTNNGNKAGTGVVAPGGPPNIVQLPQVPDTMRQADVPPTDRERVETEIIKSLIESYFSIVRKNFIDMVPKTIMYFLVNHVRDAMQNELVSELYRDAELPTLMREAEDIALRRKTCLEMRDLLAKALEIVNEVRDFNTFK